jgi:uncharacterized protein YecE (DUF72 family)
MLWFNAGSYDRAAWRRWADRIRDWQQEQDLRAVHVYFDNEQTGYAAPSARRLRGMMAA